MNVDQIKDLFKEIADEIIANEEYLTDLDRSIGDADHGYNMAKGFKAIKEDMDKDYKDLKELFNKIAMDLLSKVGGASGPLYGSFFMSFAMSLAGKVDLDRESLNLAFEKGLESVKKRGKAEVNDKTMVDVLEPVSASLNDGAKLEDVIKLAEERMLYTKDIKALKGRASYVGERSIGHIDPGSCSSYLMIKKAFGGIND
ncbi:dihydroxyacetone kinase subunit DhaL [Anaerococcus tetradius]|uniref:phosphoenolpyruvate--glycerone phosphotransferase n=1 Tax=Anaerococcus tetradius ATCC 35098 TaxID=525255 RepID=C2CF72_9FIRM|nr:dihydroxyacetone kinase subunit DhaL [Anaerococcus tetradius]EEI83691.1 dihydroxyacetone kinase, L subunit [Anaerococcus tetradius ATCC 35098]